MKYYKVLRTYNKQLISATHYGVYAATNYEIEKALFKGRMLRYEIGKVTRPKLGAIFVFNNIVDAHLFIFSSNHLLVGITVIVEGEGYISRKYKEVRRLLTGPFKDDTWKQPANVINTLQWPFASQLDEEVVLLASFKPTRICK